MNSKEFIDEELSEKLLAKALAGDKEAEAALLWLTKFNNEYHKGVVKKGDKEALHNADELRLDCYARNYLSRNDLFTAADRSEIPVDSDSRPLENLHSGNFKPKRRSFGETEER